MDRKDFHRNRTWKWIIKLVWGGCSQEQVDREKSGLFSLRAKKKLWKHPPCWRRGLFWWLWWLKCPEKGGYFGMWDKQWLTGAASLWLSPYINWRWFILVFILIARPPSQLKSIWGECHGIKGSAQDSRPASGCQGPVVVPRAEAGAARARHEGKNGQLLLPWQGGNKNKHQTLQPFGLSALLCVCSLKFPQA